MILFPYRNSIHRLKDIRNQLDSASETLSRFLTIIGSLDQMPSEDSTKPLPTIIPRPSDGKLIDISELIRGGVRLSQTECANVGIRDPEDQSQIPIEEMWKELERLLQTKASN